MAKSAGRSRDKAAQRSSRVALTRSAVPWTLSVGRRRSRQAYPAATPAAHDPIGAASSPRRDAVESPAAFFVRMPLKRRCRPSWRRSRTGRRPPDAHQLAAWRMPYQKLCFAARVPGMALTLLESPMPIGGLANRRIESQTPRMDAQGQALVALGRELRSIGYRFIAVTPSTHRIVLDRPPTRTTLQSIFGWNSPFERADLPEPIFDLLVEAGALESWNDRYKSRVRLATIDDLIFVHSAFPTDTPDAVFFGPDTYRFVRLVRGSLGDLTGTSTTPHRGYWLRQRRRRTMRRQASWAGRRCSARRYQPQGSELRRG